MKYNDLDKRRMMFIKEEDYNFLTYNILIILHGLNCIEGKSLFKDHRKLSFLIDFTSDKRLIDILENNLERDPKAVNDIDREYLNQSYTNSIFRIKTVNQVIYTLSNNNMILVKNTRIEKFDIALKKENIDKDFFKSEIFAIERNNIKRLKKLVHRISIIDITNLLDKLYFNNGVLNEQIIN